MAGRVHELLPCPDCNGRGQRRSTACGRCESTGAVHAASSTDDALRRATAAVQSLLRGTR